MSSQLLILAVLVVGVLHTLVPDHWVPITLIARQRGWSTAQTARAAALAGLGHTLSTLLIAVVLWVAGVAFAARFGHAVNLLASIALIGFGAWVAIGALRELAAESHHHDHALSDHDHDAHGHHHHEPTRQAHAHIHKHEGGPVHTHWHTHGHDWHSAEGNLALAPPLHEHAHSTSGRTAMLLVLGSSPMVEGIPAFFAASQFGIGLIAIMSVVFALATIGTYVALCVASTAGLQRMNLGPFERYGEVISGAFIAVLGVVFLFVHP
ncbi:MAG: hypothetical protein M3Z41_10330 [Candidatus Eremiobacteraeota bacterium]|nr:hypothetical protein [Candidatus Eremiobacteraeota bacterium]